MQSIVDGVVSLDEKFLVEDVADYTDDHLECIKRQGWEINDAFRNLQTTRDILAIWSVTTYFLCIWWRRLTRFLCKPDHRYGGHRVLNSWSDNFNGASLSVCHYYDADWGGFRDNKKERGVVDWLHGRADFSPVAPIIFLFT